MFRRPSLAIVMAVMVAVTQLVSISLVYISVDWYVDHAEAAAVELLPPEAKAALNSLNRGTIPDSQALAALAVLFPELEETTEAAPIAGLLAFGTASIVLTSLVGVFLAYRIAAPLARLTAAADKIRSGDFQVEVEAGATREVEALALTLNSLATELLDLEKRLKFNTRAVAHELRTPLTVLQGNLQGMNDGVVDISDERIRALLAQTQSMSRLVDQLNTLSLAGTANFVTPTTFTDLSLHVSDTVSIFEASAGRGVACRMYLATAPAWIDPPRFRQALLALLENARRYASDCGPIDVRTGIDEVGRSFVSVEDQGPGLPSYVQEASFDIFWRSEGLNGHGANGTGLGLTIVKAIAEGHNARLSVGNKPAGGAHATISFHGKTKPL